MNLCDPPEMSYFNDEGYKLFAAAVRPFVPKTK
jgi:hypothetical protein